MARTVEDIPEAWPALLSRKKLCAYLGDISTRTLLKVCPVAPLDLGANVILYDRRRVDAWIATLPLRLPRTGADEQDAPPEAADPLTANDRPASAVERARRRAGER